MTAPAPPQGTATAAAAAGTATAYEQQQQQLREQLAAAMLALYAGTVVGGMPDPAAIARFIQRMLPISVAAQRAMSTLTIAQLQAQVRPVTPIRVIPESVTTPEVLRGQPADVVYARPFKEIRWQLDQGKTVEQAIEAGRRRAQSIILTDLQLAKTHTAREYLDRAAEQPANRVVGFRRVLSSNPNHCALCILASTQRYHSFDLLPIHPGCGCDVAPILGTSDPGQVLDAETAESVHEAIRRDLGDKYVQAGGRGPALYRDIVIVNDHGEIGPVLGVRGQNFAGDYLPHRRLNAEPEPPLND